ncbi:uncharacterized protein KGF55_001462 [Candida pseudojiufengensis]|uniref:uncharacterized protein n=1 Tax=Candida pseudojiufengensis TaxID=497109 RepID=UPI0022253FC8|nr:uncharacterized protein KGF55_001462 [Candida pseudojiufengensis]KAI5965242.1 hypothetical protein KGF55_001462 [Candida pseudojiufengensis]
MIRRIFQIRNTVPVLIRSRHFSKQSFTRRNLLTIPKLIIEEPVKYSNKQLQTHQEEIANYKLDSKLPSKLKNQLINSKIESAINLDNNDPDILNLIEFALSDSQQSIPLNTSIFVFNNLYDQLIKVKPIFLESIIKSLLSNTNSLPDETIILLLDYISKQRGTKFKMRDIYERFIGTKESGNEFVSKYLTFLLESKKLRLQHFEDLVHFKINDNFITTLNRYLESLFEGYVPDSHCWENLEYSIDRVQILLNEAIDKADLNQLSMNSIFTLYKLNEEFLSVNNCEASLNSQTILIRNLDSRCNQMMEFLTNHEIEESTLENLLIALKSNNSKLLDSFLNSFSSNEKYSDLFKLQTKIIGTNNVKSEELIDHLQALELSQSNFETIIHTVSKTNPDLVDEIIEFYKDESIDPTPMIYKYKLDQLISQNNYDEAIRTFNNSTTKISWSDQIDNPTILKTLNDLIQCICSNLNIREAFPLFQKIKANMNQQQINIDSLNVLIPKMLDENLVGDTIETLKRELPDLSKHLAKLPTDQPYGEKYLQLFITIHDYCITNVSDSTIKNNWYLFIQLYKYFNIPENKILPTLKFFCENKRWNSALLIFTKMCDLHQLHGDHNYPPPSKEIYAYLLHEFGNNLYEEGVVEIHDWLKMDTSISQIDLQLNNILMNSYCNLQDVSKVRDLFITANVNHQIDEESAVILIKAYTYNDLNYVEKFYNNLSQFDLFPTAKIYKQYLIAYAYYGQIDKVFELLEEHKDEFEVTEDLLMNIYNYCYIKDKQIQIPKLATEKYPEIWSNVVENRFLIDSDGYKPHEHFLVDGSTKEIIPPKSIES